MQRSVQELYKLPSEIEFCKLCTISNQRPRISFDSEGVCSACRFSEYKRKKIDWNSREKELLRLLDRYRKDGKTPDVVVPCSGGKDGSFVAHQLKNKYGMTPLCVTFPPNIPTELGQKNLARFVEAGFLHQMAKRSEDVNRKMVKESALQLGDPFQAFIYGQTNFPMKVAVKENIPLIFYGENGEVEYGGDMKNAHRPSRDISDHVKHYFSGLPAEAWLAKGLTHKDLEPYLPPTQDQVDKLKIEIHFYSYYQFWDPQENYYYAAENTGFQANLVRSEGTYSKYASLDDKIDGFHYYLGFIKFGIGRTTSDTAHEVRDGKISRTEGVSLVRKYDGEFPARYFKEFLIYAGITEFEFLEMIDSWRAPHIWQKVDSFWRLRQKIYAGDSEAYP